MYLPREEGQGLVEYALILVLVAIVVIAILALLGPQIANIFSRLTSGLSTTYTVVCLRKAKPDQIVGL